MMVNSTAPQKRIAAIRRSGLLDRAGSEQFGHLTELVRVMLDAPVAVISIVDENRQVFAGHSGLPEPWSSRGETPITHSFCQHVVANEAPLIVSDANVHELVNTNHAIADLGVVGYLGVPISLPTGELVGALAAIDTSPREWTERDRLSLEALAKVVEKEIAVGVSELKYRTLFTDMQEGYYVASAVRNADAELVDVVFEDVNPAFERLTGLPPEVVIGSTLSSLVPQTLEDMLPAYERVFRGGEAFVHANNATTLGGRWYENRLRRIDNDRLFSIFTDVTDRKTSEGLLRDSEAYWRGLFEQLAEGFILGEVVRDDDGKVVDWVYKEVNRAWGELVGVPSERAFGRTIREVFPGIEDEWVTEFAEVVETGKSKVFTRQVGTIERWYEGHAQPVGNDRFVVLFLEVTERLKMEADLRDREKLLRTVVDTMHVGVLLTEAPSGRVIMQNERLVQLIGHDATKATSIELYDIFKAVDANGFPIDPNDYPLARVMRGDAETSRLDMLYQRPDGNATWLSVVAEAIKDTSGKLVGGVGVVSDISERKSADDQQNLVNREMSHRLKNMLAMVQAIATQTLKPITDRQYVDAFEKRLQALSSAHDVLLNQSRDEAPIRSVIFATLARLVPSDRLDLGGPDVMVGPKGTLSLALLLHELATNAVKYGAFSNENGRVSLIWEVEDGEAEPTVRLRWIEAGGPPAQEPSRKGFGTKLINMGLIGSGGVAIDYNPKGLRVTMSAPLSQLQHTE